MKGPLKGLRVIEMGGIGPVPFAAMLMADLGAEVIRILRPGSRIDPFDITSRGRPSLELNLQADGGADAVLALASAADILVEGFRPGVMERLGVGPEVCLKRNPRLIYGRMTGWGQTGPLAEAAGHDINYIAISGALHAIGTSEGPPVPPLNFVGDYGGGAMLLLFGVMSALHETGHSGKGQVVDVAMSDGAALLSTVFYGLRASGHWKDERGSNVIDGGSHFYGTYACLDGKYVAVGAIEPQFYQLLCEKCGITDLLDWNSQNRDEWPSLKQRLGALFATRTRDEWCELLEGTDACVAPVLDWKEAPAHRHNVARETFIDVDGIIQPAPAPRFSRTPTDQPLRRSVRSPENLLSEWGFGESEIRALRESNAIPTRR